MTTSGYTGNGEAERDLPTRLVRAAPTRTPPNRTRSFRLAGEARAAQPRRSAGRTRCGRPAHPLSPPRDDLGYGRAARRCRDAKPVDHPPTTAARVDPRGGRPSRRNCERGPERATSARRDLRDDRLAQPDGRRSRFPSCVPRRDTVVPAGPAAGVTSRRSRPLRRQAMRLLPTPRRRKRRGEGQTAR